MSGDVHVRFCEGPGVRFPRATHPVIVCAREDDARRVWEVLPKRLARFGLRLNADKTRLLRFGRPPQVVRSRDRGRGPSSFDFLGLTHYWKRSHRGSWILTRKTAKTRFARAVTTVHQWCRRHRHDPLPDQHWALCQKLQGHYAYYGVRGNFRALSRFRHQVARSWLKWLQRRSQRATLTREQRGSLLKRWPLPTPRIRSYWTGPGQATG